MEDLLERIRSRLTQGAYTNEAAVSIGILIPVLKELGWDASDPDQVIPEYTSGRGRVDFALCTPPRRPSVFVEVKGVGRSIEGDRQLFEYAFHEGVPLCVLTDGREWSFYLPGGQGSYDDRRVYRLQLDERTASECARVLDRYLSCNRVRSGAALEDASKDYRDAAARREASRSLPNAWAEMVSEPEELLMELLADRAEALCGFRPSLDEALAYLQSLSPSTISPSASKERIPTPPSPSSTNHPKSSALHSTARIAAARVNEQRAGVQFTLFGKLYSSPSGNAALVEILRELARRNPDKVEQLAHEVRGRSRNHVARTAQEIYPARPDLARAAEFAPGWLVGLNIANREKITIVRAACSVFGVSFGQDVVLVLPNA